MKLKIEIECETFMEAAQHLYQIKKEFKKHLKEKGIKTYQQMMDNSAEKRSSFEDNNCYGTHIVKLYP